jgi:hypothetical protein
MDKQEMEQLQKEIDQVWGRYQEALRLKDEDSARLNWNLYLHLKEKLKHL